MDKSHDSYIISSVDNALRVLTKLSKGSGLSIREMSRELDISRSTLYRILRTLESRNFVRIDKTTEKYNLGISLLELSESTSKDFDIRKIANPYLFDLRDRTGETVQLAVIDGGEIVIFENIEGTGELRFYSPAGVRLPITYGNFGKIFLSDMDEKKVEIAIKEYPLIKYTSKSIIDIKRFKKCLKTTRKNKCSVGVNDPIDGGFNIAAPLFNKNGKIVASIALVGPNSIRNMERMNELKKLVKNIAYDISKELGYIEDSY